MQSFKVPLDSKLDESTYNEIYQAAKNKDKSFFSSLPENIKIILYSYIVSSPVARLAEEKDVESVEFVLGYLQNLPNQSCVSRACMMGYASAGWVEEIEKNLLRVEENHKPYFLNTICLGLIKFGNLQLSAEYLNRSHTREILELCIADIFHYHKEPSHICLFLTMVSPIHHEIALEISYYFAFEWAALGKEFERLMPYLSWLSPESKHKMLEGCVDGYINAKRLDMVKTIINTETDSKKKDALNQRTILILSKYFEGEEDKIEAIINDAKDPNKHINLRLTQVHQNIVSGKYVKALRLSSDPVLSEQNREEVKKSIARDICIKYEKENEQKILETLGTFSIPQSQNILIKMKLFAFSPGKEKIQLDCKTIRSVEAKFNQINKKMSSHPLSFPQSYIWLSQKEVIFWILSAPKAKNLPTQLISNILSFILAMSLQKEEIVGLIDTAHSFFKTIKEKKPQESPSNLVVSTPLGSFKPTQK